MSICNICDSSQTKKLISKNDYNVFECINCGLAFTYPQPESLADQYDESYFSLYKRRRKFRLKRANTRLKTIELLQKPGKVLDIGCSLGYFLEAAKDRGWEVSGIEISGYASSEAKKAGFDVIGGVLESDTYNDQSFDCVTMWDVLEHVPDPTSHMLNVNKVLKPGGLVVIGTPDLSHVMFKIKKENWRHLKPWEHIYYFRDSSIKRLFEKTGFTLVNPPSQGIPGLKSLLSRTIKPNDVRIYYGVKNAVEI